MIDLLNINRVHIDTETNVLSVGGGCFLKDVDTFLKPFHLSITLGVKPEVGIGGQVLSGGYGFLARNYGLSVDHFIQAEVVLADGTIVNIHEDDSEDEENENFSDLFWGLKGGGGEFLYHRQ